MPHVEASTALYGVVGWPLRRTLSPQLHNAAFTALGIPAVYVPLRVSPDRGGRILEALETLGLCGANITVPHKEAAYRQCDQLSPDARAASSVNTLVRTESGWEGHTTDGPGLVDALCAGGCGPAGRVVALLGAGGGARSVAVSLLRLDGVRLRVVTRDPRRASRLLSGVEDVGRGSSLEIVRRGTPPAERTVRGASLVLNATTLGSHGGRDLPCPVAWVGRDAVAVDFVYGADTPWLRALRRRGGVAFSGLGMLIHQAARSFEMWTGRKALKWMLWAGGWDDELARSGRAPAGARGRAAAKPRGAGC
ncbi:MAG TPA: shikimate dehydrogenase [Candidatus Saccharimonadales bacterium]|nr:shikimate dehydrogenase [Candidatus Saccharimonadales bacterium]